MFFGCKLQDHAGNTFRVKATTKSQTYTDEDAQYITNIQQRNYAVVHTLKDKHYQKKTSTSNEITI